MRKARLILSLLVVGLAFNHIKARDQSSYKNNVEIEHPQLFRAGFEYEFQYNGQIALGLVDINTLEEQPINRKTEAQQQQKAVTRIQTQVKINFNSERHATLRFEQTRIGQINTHIEDAQNVQPMVMFERKSIDKNKLREIQLPCKFSYVDGVVENILFHPEDKVWSKNIKRAVLNMIQLNLKPVNEKLGNNIMTEDEKLYTTKAYTVPEITVEGDCQSTYTINSNSNVLRRRSEITEMQNESINFNVTKSIAFKQCKNISDVAFGFQSQPIQHPRCVQCMRQWLNINNKNQEYIEDNFYYKNSCSQICDPKEVREQYLERSTVMRAECFGRPEQNYGIKRTELVSHYVYKTAAAEINVKDSKQPSSAMHAIVAAELRFIAEKQMPDSRLNAQIKESSERNEILMYDNQIDAEEKRFYMYGNEEFGRHTPFHAVQNKAEIATLIYRRILQAASDKINGIESAIVSHLPRLIETLRMCSVEELEQISMSLIENKQKQQSEIERKKCMQIFADTLAIAGTRNTIAVMVKHIQLLKIPISKAVHTISTLQNLPAPSDSIVEILLQLVKSEQCRRFPALKQSALLTVGTLVSEVCRHRAQNSAERFIYGTQTGFDKVEICSRNKKEAYKQAFLEQYKQAETTYEKILVLKAIGNAGLDNTVSTFLESIIRESLIYEKNQYVDEDESVLVRIHAIDALRRLTTQMPQKIQRLLLPIFQNGLERPEIRLSAFTILMLTNPERTILDLIVNTLMKENSQDIRAFVYNTLKMLSRSVLPAEQDLVRKLKIALKMVNIDDTTASSTIFRVPSISRNEEQNIESIIMQIASMFRGSENQMIPTHMYAAVHTIFDDQLQLDRFKISASQINLNRWVENLMSIIMQIANRQNMKKYASMRAQRDNAENSKRAEEEFNSIFSDLKIKRRSSIDKRVIHEKPFGMICIRIGDIDKVILAFDEQTLPEVVKMILKEERPSLADLSQLQNLNGVKKYFRILSAMNFNENFAVIPTSMGLPLHILHTQPILISLDAETKLQIESGTQLNAKFSINGHTSVSTVEFRKLEVRLQTILAVGVESMRAVEAHLPIQAELQYQLNQRLKIAILTPMTPKTRLMGLHTLTITYIRNFDAKIHLYREPKLKTVHSPHLEPHQVFMDKLVGENTLGLPVRIKGHYYLPSKSTSQSIFDYLTDLSRISLSSENHLHITFEATQDTPREIEFELNAAMFENLKTEDLHVPTDELHKIYNNVNYFEVPYPNENNTEVFEDYTERSERFNTFVNKLEKSKMYKHSLKLAAQTIGGSKQVKAEMKLFGTCDALLKYCKLAAEIKRTPMFLSEMEWWTLKADAEIVAPETVSSPAELDLLKSLKNQKLVAHAQIQWGSNKKQNINLRIQGVSDNAKHLEKLITSQTNEEDKLKIKRELAFLNKFNIGAKYQLDDSTQNIFARLMEIIKSYIPWNTESKLLSNISGRPIEHTLQKCSETQDCEFYANVVIEPITQRYANISMQTVSQVVRLTFIPLLLRICPYVLVRAEDKPTHSAMQFLTRYADKSRAECAVDGRRVQTFDGVEYAAPISTCYSVLANNCGNDTTKFSVLMKGLDENGMQKKIKLITRNQIIECEPKVNDNDSKKLTCKVNGQEITQKSQKQLIDIIVEYNNEEKTSVDLYTDEICVRFKCLCSDCKCQKATIKLSKKFKHLQCGLCGHYDDSTRDEFRMNNDEETKDLIKFHRSYSLKDKEECSSEKQDSFYLAKQRHFNMISPLNSEEGKESHRLKEDNEKERQTLKELDQWKDGGYATDSDKIYTDSSESSDEIFNEDEFYFRKNNNRQQSVTKQQVNKYLNEKNPEPQLQTIVLEHNHQICFSVQPVKRCVGKSRSNWMNADIENDEEITPKKINMGFACLERFKPEVQFMKKQAFTGVIIDVSLYEANYNQKITETEKCISY